MRKLLRIPKKSESYRLVPMMLCQAQILIHCQDFEKARKKLAWLTRVCGDHYVKRNKLEFHPIFLRIEYLSNLLELMRCRKLGY